MKSFLIFVAVLCVSGQLLSQTYTYTTFDEPNAGVLPNEGTIPGAINALGVVTGRYVDPFGVNHGFLRIPATARRPAQFISFDAPGAGTNPGQGTFPWAINDLGFVSGAYFDSTTTYHAFIYAGLLGGGFTTFSVPGSTTLPFLGTLDESINLWGYSTGQYHVEAGNGVTSHGFLRSPLGALTKLDVPAATDTIPASVNLAGTVTGSYLTTDFLVHGFTRTLAGVLTKFDIPGCRDTFPVQIANDGTIAGQCPTSAPPLQTSQGFVRAPNGTSNVFTVSGATNTVPLGLGPDGTIVGISYDPDSVDGIPLQPLQGFVRSPNGNLTIVKVPGATTTWVNSINGSGVITGSYSDALGANHGFTASPR